MRLRRPTRCVILKACSVLCAVLVAMSLLSKLDSRNDYIRLIDSVLFKIDTEKSVYPNETYFVIHNVTGLRAQATDSREYAITICTQTSLGNLHHIINLSKIWNGLISVAVFSFGEEIMFALHYIILMQKCSRNIQRKVRFHLVYPISKPPLNLTSLYGKDFDCHILPFLRLSFVAENYALGNISYPVNLLRTVALVHSTSAYVLNLDIDLIPSKQMKNEMETFLKTRKLSDKQKKLAYVIPCFESNITFYDSPSKQELLVAMKYGDVRQFTFRKCFDCHVATNYSRWLSLLYPSEMDASYAVNFSIPYEPFYIAHRNQLPLFDAIFKQYGFNRVSQICEAYISGYEFVVMNNAFIIHEGFKDPNKHHQWKEKENKKNYIIFDTVFKQYLKTKYPNTTRVC